MIKRGTYEIKLNGKSTGWYGKHYDCVQVLKKLDNQSHKLMVEVAENTGLWEIDQNEQHNVNARHLTFTVAKRNKSYNSRGVYSNAYCKTIAPNNTGKTVFGFDGFVDVWTIKEVKGEI